MRNSYQVVLILLLVFFVGCGGGPNPEKMFADRLDEKVKRLAFLYGTFQAGNKYVGPADEKEFRNYIDGMSETRLNRLQIDKSEINELFKSERDGKPYRIRWAMVGGNGVPAKPILFETDGVEGKYIVGFTNGTSQEFSKTDYDKLWDGTGDDGSMTGDAGNSARPENARPENSGG